MISRWSLYLVLSYLSAWTIQIEVEIEISVQRYGVLCIMLLVTHHLFFVLLLEDGMHRSLTLESRCTQRFYQRRTDMALSKDVKAGQFFEINIHQIIPTASVCRQDRQRRIFFFKLLLKAVLISFVLTAPTLAVLRAFS